MSFKTVSQDLMEAELVKSKLQSQGIFCELRTNDAGGVMPHLRNAQGVQLYVSELDKEKAFAVLKELK